MPCSSPPPTLSGLVVVDELDRRRSAARRSAEDASHFAARAFEHQHFAVERDVDGADGRFVDLDVGDFGQPFEGHAPLAAQPAGLVGRRVAAFQRDDLQVELADLLGERVDLGREVLDLAAEVLVHRVDAAVRAC